MTAAAVAIAVGVIAVALVLIHTLGRRRRADKRHVYIAAFTAFCNMYEYEFTRVGPYRDEVAFPTVGGVPVIVFEGSDFALERDTLREWGSNVSTVAFQDDMSDVTADIASLLPETHRGGDVVCVSHSRGGYLMSAWCRDAPAAPHMAMFVGSPGQAFDVRQRGTHVLEFKHRYDPVPKLGWVTSDHEHEFTTVPDGSSIATVHLVRSYAALIAEITETIRTDTQSDYKNFLTAYPS